jgi:creatinine amidohydrolase
MVSDFSAPPHAVFSAIPDIIARNELFDKSDSAVRRRFRKGKMRNLYSSILVFAAAAVPTAQTLPVKWEELTAGDFVAAIQKAQGTCVLPFGILEKHGPQLPLGTDLINVRYAALHGAAQEYAGVYPEYYFGQIFEAKHEPGTIAHGGNNSLLPFFAQSQMVSPRDYVVYVYQPTNRPPGRPPMKSSFDSHAGEAETSHMMVSSRREDAA